MSNLPIKHSTPSNPQPRSRLRRLARIAVLAAVSITAALALAFAGLLLWPLDPAPYLAAQPSPQMLDRDGRLLHPFLNPAEQWCLDVPLDAVSPWLIQATLAAEDQRFYWHLGVDPLAIARAAGQNAASRRIVSGASTLTMQLVKITQGGERTLSSKIAQASAALRLEARTSKPAILEAYLNKAPYGLNLIGCEAAARRYFGKPARELTLAEAALLAGLPRSPTRLNPLRHPEAARERRDFVLARMRQEGRITAEQCRAAQAEPLAAAWNALPAAAPHLARRLRPLADEDGRISTTLDAAIQVAVEAALPRRVNALDAPINNAAAIVIDVRTAEVLARAGSAAFFDIPSAGQVDVARARRSPGSTLKPFLYALAMDRHRLYASERLLDASLDYGLYNPANFDGEFRGLVTADEALRRSLNVPAVTILERLGAESALDDLRRLGFSSLNRPAWYYGLGLALGGGEVRLEELAEAYTTLAALGVHRPLRVWRAEDRSRGEKDITQGQRVLSRGACLQIFSMLAGDLNATPLAEDLAPAGPRARVCWKTGTSAGRRDAWAVAFDANHVVAVWVGNTQGRFSPGLVGADAALPLALEIFRALPAGAAPAMPDPNGDLIGVAVCARSGLPASPACPARETVQMARGQLLHRRCALHVQVETADGTMRSEERWPAGAHGWDLAAIAPPALASATMQSAADMMALGELEIERLDLTHDGNGSEIAGAHTSNSGARATRPNARSTNASAPALRILDPAPRAELILTGENRGDVLRLRASTSDAEALSWFLNGRFVGESAPGEPFWLPLAPGDHTLACMNAGGATARTTFRVHPIHQR